MINVTILCIHNIYVYIVIIIYFQSNKNRNIIIVILFQVIYLISFLNTKLLLLHNPNKSVTINSETK